MRLALCFSVLVTAVCMVADGAIFAAESPKDAKEADYSAELPRIPPRSAEESLRAMRLRSGFHAELVASEPDIRSPMALEFDEFGRAFVVELPEYNQYGSARPQGAGSVRMLEDTDGDGRFDRSTVFVDNLNYPTALACWDGGIMVGVAPDILYCRDTDGDGRADVRQRVFTGFGQDKAGEGMLNSFRWRIDGTIHIPTGLDGGEIVAVAESARVGAAGGRLQARGQHLLLDPRTMTLTATSGGGQHGMCLDDWNLRAFVCGNSEPVHLIMYDGRYLARNPYLEAPAAAVNIAPDGKFTRLMRISDVEPWRILRTRLRKSGTIPGSDEGGTPSGFFTGATGITVYRGDAWPDEYRGQLFVGEVANNLVYRARTEVRGIGLTAERADPAAEFLASSDNWFRPVQFANGPDGNLYVIDMYRELIEGAAFLAPQILKHMDPSAGYDKGRIYRIARDGFRPRAVPCLADLSSPELVRFFEHPNGWHRDTASRLIWQRQDPAAVASLRGLARNSSSALARVMALYALRGMGALDAADVLLALQASAAGSADGAGSIESEVHSLRLAEVFPADMDVRDAVIRAAADEDLRVRYQAAFSLGAFPGDAATGALRDLAVRDGSDSWMQLAILSSIGERRGTFTGALLQDREIRRQPHVRSIITAAATQIGASGAEQDLDQFLGQLDVIAADREDPAAAAELVRGIVSRHPAVSPLLAKSKYRSVRELLQRSIHDAVSVARDSQKPPEERADSVRYLAAGPYADLQDIFTSLLQSREPQPVQAAALEALARFDEVTVPGLIIRAWPAQTPQLRANSLETLFTRTQWIIAFLDAVEAGDIARGEVDAARAALLQQHRDPTVQSRAQALFSGNALARRQEVVDAYQPALAITGDIERGRQHFRKTCAACHRLEAFGESIGAELNAIRDRGMAAVLLNVLDPNREVKPQFLTYVVVLESGRTMTGMIAAETATSLTLRKPDNTSETVLRVNIDELKSTGLSFMPEGLEKQVSVSDMADVLAYLNSIK